ncbi:NAD(P)H-quinone oxidoreductase [Myxococcota bacterium]|nr:NAD(P)H-quinone oxidoreductase [Myxococcota bacterium]
MKAILFDTPGDESVLHLGEAPSPEIGPNELRIQVAATAVNRADLLQRQGFYPPPPGASEILGLECAGEVLEVGGDVRGFESGDRVMALLAGGGYAEEVAVHSGSVMAVPEGMSLEHAAAIPEVFLTVFLNVFQLASLPPGGTALVHGGGSGIGTAAIQLVKSAGGRVVVTAGTDPKCERCLELGADVAINYRTGNFREEALKATDGRGVDVVLDSIGAPYLEDNLSSLATDGRLVLIGLMGGAKAEVGLGTILSRRLSVMGSTLRTRSVDQKASIVAGFLEQFGGALSRQEIGPVVDRVLPLVEVSAAHRILKASEHFGKIVLRVG